MEILELYRRGELLGRYELARNLEVGRAPACDVVVQDEEVAERHWLVMRCDGSVMAFDVAAGRRERRQGRPVPLNAELALGREHAIKRVQVPLAATFGVRREATTQSLPRSAAGTRLFLALGSGTEARRIVLGERLVQIGRAADSDLVLHDLAVSERHARLEPAQGAVVVRDLGSRNGTFVDGVAVQTASLRHGSRLRIGRTDLRVVASSSVPRPGVLESDGPQLVAESSSMLQVLADVQRLAALNWPVLVNGESGTGKEGIALSLHTLGPRRDKRFVAVNAGGLPRELIESELFGHERGAFTGANATRRGVFEQAAGGTLFLDEIGELPLDLQSRLLRVLETGEIRRLGAERTFAVDVRLVCATHRDLPAMVAQGTFRQDLYYRVARLVLQVPALRSRLEDVDALATHFLGQIVGEVGARELTSDALLRLRSHDWPGNARELRNVVCAAAADSGAYIEAADIDRALLRLGDGSRPRAPGTDACRVAVEQYAGNKAAAARALGIPRSTLRDRLRSD
jgi:transcriptional regulator with AAA-type ATPase domain